MKQIVTLLLAVLATLNVGATPVERLERGNLVMENIPDLSAELAKKLEGYLEYRQASFRDWTPEGAILIGTRSGNVEQVHLVEQPLGEQQPLTFFTEPVTAASYSPRGVREGFAFLMDSGGDENAQIFFQSLPRTKPGEPRRLTPPRQLTKGDALNGGIVWSNDGQRFVFFSNVRQQAFYDIYVMDPVQSDSPKLIVASGGQAWYPLDWSPDDTKLLLWNYVSVNDSTLHVADLATGNRLQVYPAAQRIGIRTARFSRDGRGVYAARSTDGPADRPDAADQPPAHAAAG